MPLDLAELYRNLERKNSLYICRYGRGIADFKSWIDKPDYQTFCEIMEPILDDYEANQSKEST